jgi:hypothetical protein
MHSAAIRRVAVVLVLACACAGASLGLLTGCGSGEPRLPKVTTGVMVGPKPHRVTISLSSSGPGYGVAELVLTYPDGHTQVAGNGVLEQGISLGWTPRQLPSGQYAYTLYAVPVATEPMDAAFPSDARTEKHIVSSGPFTID